MYRSIVKITALCLALLGNLSAFGMIVRYKDEQHKKRVQANSKQTVSRMKDMCIFHKFNKLDLDMRLEIVNRLDNPLTVGQTNKENHGLVKSEGLRNLRLAYQKQDPKFVLNHYVPILPVCAFIKPKNEYVFGYISPYQKTFYPSKYPHNNEYTNNELGEGFDALEKKRVQQFKEQKQKQYQKVSFSYFTGGLPCTNQPLTLTALFGTQQAIENALQGENRPKFFNETHPIINAIHALISNPGVNDKNNALELLFKDPRALNVVDNSALNREQRKFAEEECGTQYYEFLSLSRQVKNKKAFEVFVTQDIHGCKNIPWAPYSVLPGEYSREPITVLDGVIEHNKHSAYDPFSEEDIALLKEHGAKTALAKNINTTQGHHHDQHHDNRAICTIF